VHLEAPSVLVLRGPFQLVGLAAPDPTHAGLSYRDALAIGGVQPMAHFDLDRRCIVIRLFFLRECLDAGFVRLVDVATIQASFCTPLAVTQERLRTDTSSPSLTAKWIA
jgi:hypothetical protein